MKRRLLLLGLMLCAVTLWAATYSQPFSSGHGFSPTQSGACDSSYTDNAADATDGNPVNSVHSRCVGRNDTPTTTWKKTLTWEDMGVTPGNIATAVDCALDHSIITRSHTSTPARGLCQLFNSGDTAACAASDLEPLEQYSSGTGGTAWATQNTTGAVAVNAGCQASTTSVTVKFAIRPNTGNNASATTQVNVDNLVLTITESAPATRSRAVVIGLAAPPARSPSKRVEAIW